MNYLAHGYRYLERPYFVAGTALPDWLRACDRETRFDRNAPAGDPLPDRHADLLAGIRRHLDDDRWFHQTQAFLDTTEEVTARIRSRSPRHRELRPSVIGHLLTEFVIDAELAARHPSLVDDYYAALAGLDPCALESIVNPWLHRPTQRLAPFIARFVEARHLHTYRDDDGLVRSLGTVLRRSGLACPADLASDLPFARSLVRFRLDALLLPPSASAPGRT